MIMFALEFVVLCVTIWSIMAKYVLNFLDQRNEAPWELKSLYISYVDLCTGEHLFIMDSYESTR